MINGLDAYFKGILSDLQIRRLEAKSRYDPETGCWRFDGANNAGYGVIFYKGQNEKLSRLMAVSMLGYDLNSNLLVLHKQGCPHRDCFYWGHLYIGTYSENAQDMIAMGDHHAARKTHCLLGHEFTPENTRIEGGNKRKCRQCEKLRELKRRTTRIRRRVNG